MFANSYIQGQSVIICAKKKKMGWWNDMFFNCIFFSIYSIRNFILVGFSKSHCIPFCVVIADYMYLINLIVKSRTFILDSIKRETHWRFCELDWQTDYSFLMSAVNLNMRMYWYIERWDCFTIVINTKKSYTLILS